MLSALSRSSEELEKSKHYKEKQSKRDGNKTQESVAWQQLHCAEYTYQIVFIFCQLSAFTQKIWATIWQREPPILFLDNFQKEVLLHIWRHEFCRSVDKEKNENSGWYHRQNVFHTEFL